MAFWILEKRGHGKFMHFLPKQITSKRAGDLESQGEDVFDTKKDAQRRANELRGN